MAMPNLLEGKTPLQSRFVIKARKPKLKRKKSKIAEAVHEKWFFNLNPKYFVQLQKEWNEKRLSIVLPKLEDYDAWLNYFKTLPPNTIRMLAATGMDILPTEAYAALSRWHDIITNPHRIDKIHQSGLTNNGRRAKDHKTIVQLALANDRLGVLKATRDQIAEKLEKGAGARDTAALAREMTEIMTQISDYEKRIGPKKDTALGYLLEDMPGRIGKRQRDKGARNTSFKSRVTIKDVEA